MRVVKDAMVSRVVIVDSRTLINGAAQIISCASVEVLLVSRCEKIVGVVSERNLVTGALIAHATKRKVFVLDVMFKDLMWVQEDDDLETTKSAMRSQSIRNGLVQAKSGNLVGTLLVGLKA